MFWDAAATGFQGVRFLAHLCGNDAPSDFYGAARRQVDDLAARLARLGERGEAALLSVRQNIGHSQTRRTSVHRKSCRVSGSSRPHQLTWGDDQRIAPEFLVVSRNHNRTQQLALALAETITVIAANMMPTIGLSWYDRQQWMFQQAKRSHVVSEDLAKLVDGVRQAMRMLGSELQLQDNTDVAKMCVKNDFASALNKSDIQGWQMQNREAITEEMQRWSEEQQRQMEKKFFELLQSLESKHLKHAAGRSSSHQHQFTLIPYSSVQVDWEDEVDSLISKTAAGEVWKGTLRSEGITVPIAFEKLDVLAGRPQWEREDALRNLKREAEARWLLTVATRRWYTCMNLSPRRKSDWSLNTATGDAAVAPVQYNGRWLIRPAAASASCCTCAGG